MDRSNLEKTFKAMKLADLKKYLQNRGISVSSHLKPGLVAIACAAEDMKLPLINQVNEDEEQLNVSRRLFVHGIQLPDPFTMNVLNDFKHSPANRGSVIDAYCHCLGGRDGGCKHISAALYSLDDLLHSSGEDSVTSGPCQWNRKPKPDTTACEVKDLPIKRSLEVEDNQHEESQSTAVKKKRSKAYTFSQFIDHDPRIVSDRLPCGQDRLASIVKSMQRMTSEPLILSILAKQLYGSGEVLVKDKEQDCSKKEGDDPQLGLLEQKILAYIQSSRQPDTKSFRATLQFTEAEINEVDSVTKSQWQCKIWFMHKTGFITASKAKSVYTRQISVEKHKTDVSSLVKSLTDNRVSQPIKRQVEIPLNPLDWGLKHENTARKAYYRTEGRKHHQLSLVSKGFLISKKKPFLGGSPDNVTTCKCQPKCQSVVVEYKCPWSHKDINPKEAFLQPEIGGMWEDDKLSLKSTSRYYYQVQMLMLVTELEECHLVVWTRKGIFCHHITYVPSFIEKISLKLEAFWVANVVPRMMEKMQCHNPKSSGEQILNKRECEQESVNLSGKVVVPSASQSDLNSSDINQSSHLPDLHCGRNNSGVESCLKKSVVLYCFDVYQEDMDMLKPGKLISDTIVSVMLSEHWSDFPIVDSLFYSVLVGEQESRAKTSTRMERMIAAEKFFKSDMLLHDYVFIPINRSLHWFLVIVTPWHILILDSLTWDIETRTTTVNLISRYIDYLVQTNCSIIRKDRSPQILKVPQQEMYSNNCAIHLSLSVKYFLQDIEKYEQCPDDYIALVHRWFTHIEAKAERQRMHGMVTTRFYWDENT